MSKKQNTPPAAKAETEVKNQTETPAIESTPESGVGYGSTFDVGIDLAAPTGDSTSSASPSTRNSAVQLTAQLSLRVTGRTDKVIFGARCDREELSEFAEILVPHGLGTRTPSVDVYFTRDSNTVGVQAEIFEVHPDELTIAVFVSGGIRAGDQWAIRIEA
jgi:hypothetical protein